MTRKTFDEASAAWERGDLAAAYASFLHGARAGDSGCQLNVGFFHDTGLQVSVDKDGALQWYHRAYRQGEAAPASNIGTIWRDRGQSRRALWWFHRAVSLGDGDALLEIARIHLRGRGVPRSTRLAKHYYERALSHRSITPHSVERAKDALQELAA